MPFALVGVGFVAGIASGMFGIGGGLIIVPLLTVFFAFDQHSATGTSLAAIMLPVGLFAVLAYHRAGKLSIRVAALVAGGLVFGSILGANIALNLSAELMGRLYGVFLLVMGWRFAEPRKMLAAWQAARRPGYVPVEPPPAPQPGSAPPLVLFGVGLAAGVLAGMFGIGGGVVIVPALVGLLRFDQKEAVGTSLGALLLPVSFGAVVAYYQAGELDPATALYVAIGLLFGALAGARIALGLPSKTVKRLYGVFLLFVALRFLFQTYS